MKILRDLLFLLAQNINYRERQGVRSSEKESLKVYGFNHIIKTDLVAKVTIFADEKPKASILQLKNTVQAKTYKIITRKT